MDSPLTLAAYADLQAELWINATSGHGALPALQAVGPALDGKVVIDTSNPLDYLPRIPADAVRQQHRFAGRAAAARRAPGPAGEDVLTMANEVMTDPRGLGQESTIFVAGNDEAARADRRRLWRRISAGPTSSTWAT